MSLCRHTVVVLAGLLVAGACGGGDPEGEGGAEVHGDVQVHGDLHVAGQIVAAAGDRADEEDEHATDQKSHVSAQGPHAETAPGALAHWSYDGTGGPPQWGSLDNRYSACSEGRAQSPIDFVASDLTQLPALSFSYRALPLRIENVGNNLHVDATGAGGVLFATKEYRLARIEFHAPSEHLVHGESFSFAAHLVHESADGESMIVAVPFELGDRNPTLETFWRHLPQSPGPARTHEQVIYSIDTMLPVNRSYYMYIGSSTTPPCSEGVRWVFLRDAVSVSQRQIEQFTEIFPKSTRPVQPANGRTIGQGM